MKTKILMIILVFITVNLSIAQFSDLSPLNYILGGSDDTNIGNISDSLKVISTNTAFNPNVIEFQEYHHDAFSRFRVSAPEAIYEGGFTTDPFNTGLFDLYYDYSTASGATVTWDSDTVSLALNVTTAIGSKAVFKSRRNIEYYRGKANQYLITGRMYPDAAPVAGRRKRYGAFDEDNGVFFEVNGTTLRVCVRSKTTGTVVDTCVDQSNWNSDTMDGTCDPDAPTYPACDNNPSGITALPTKQQLFEVDYSWLGANVVRFSLIIDGHYTVVHQFNFSNNVDQPWAQYGQFPIRAEIENITAQAAADTLKITCFNTNSEGGTVDKGPIKYVSTGTTEISVNITEKVIAGIKLQDAYRNKSLKVLGFTIANVSGSKAVYWKMIHNATLTSPTWSNASTGIADLLQNDPAYTGGHIIAEGHVLPSNKDSSGSLDRTVKSDVYLGNDLANVADNVILVVRTISGNGTIIFSGNYLELY